MLRAMRVLLFLVLAGWPAIASPPGAEDVKSSEAYARIKAQIDQVRVIDTHDHLRPEAMEPRDETSDGKRVTLRGVLSNSYLNWVQPIAAWPAGQPFEKWWEVARPQLENVRAVSFYRYLLPAFRDLYGVEFETITEAQAAKLDADISTHYRGDKWRRHVVVDRAGIDLMLIDPWWAPLDFRTAWPDFDFVVPVMRADPLIEPFVERHHDGSPTRDPLAYAKANGLTLAGLDDYLSLVGTILDRAQAAGAVGLKCGAAYRRSLEFKRVTRERAAAVFAATPEARSEQDLRDFEDFMFWHVAQQCAQRKLPLQIHTGLARLPGSNPMLLAQAIAGNPQTTFVLFHGGFPWIEETGALALSYRNVWIDSNWLSNLSYSAAKRAYQTWLEIVPSNRIIWGGDNAMVEGIYGATCYTRQCLAEALTEKVLHGELREELAVRIARQILRDNALELYPSLKARLSR